MTMFLPMNRIQDELKKVDQFRKRISPTFSFVQQYRDFVELEENNLGLALIVREARKNNIPWFCCDSNLKMIIVDPKGDFLKKAGINDKGSLSE